VNPGTLVQVPNIKDTLPEFQGQDMEDPKYYIGTAEPPGGKCAERILVYISSENIKRVSKGMVDRC
jgi:hypothetical protein